MSVMRSRPPGCKGGIRAKDEGPALWWYSQPPRCGMEKHDDAQINGNGEAFNVKTGCCLKSDRGAIAWGWLVALMAVAAAAAVIVYLFPPPMVSDAPPTVVRGKIPPMPEPATEPLQTAADPQTAAPASESAVTAPLSADGEVDEPAIDADAAGDEGRDDQQTGQEPDAAAAIARPDAAPALATPPVDDAGTSSPAGASVAEEGAAEPASTASADASPVPAADAVPGVDSAAADPVPEARVPSDTVADRGAAAVPQTGVQTAAPEGRAGEGTAPYTVQVGAFRNRKNADTQAAELAWRGYPPYIFQITTENGSLLYLVRFGHFETPAEATSAAAAFKEKEQMPAVVVRTARP